MKMKELLKQYAAYNVWATQRILDTIIPLPEEKQLAEVPSSFNSLYKTVLHVWDAESIWWQRMKMQERIIRPSENFKGTMQDVSTGLIQQSKQWEEWVSSASDLLLDHVFQYYDNKKEHFKMPVYQMLHHVFNHGTYHRGQLVNMLHQLGIEKVQATDFSLWRIKK
ncbi:MAG: DinB family protein [Bacteroidota bacterium]